MKINLPTVLTLMRIFYLPFGLVCYNLPFTWAHPLTAILSFVVGTSDFFDGYLARRYNQSTRFGAFLDPVADKLAVATGLILVTGEYHFLGLTICAIIIVARELAISALREWMAEQGKRTSVAVQLMGKVKTCFQGVAIIFLLWFNPLSPQWVFQVGFYCLLVATLLTIWSMFVYLKLAWKELSIE